MQSRLVSLKYRRFRGDAIDCHRHPVPSARLQPAPHLPNFSDQAVALADRRSTHA